jgi:hypothetical protein
VGGQVACSRHSQLLVGRGDEQSAELRAPDLLRLGAEALVGSAEPPPGPEQEHVHCARADAQQIGNLDSGQPFALAERQRHPLGVGQGEECPQDVTTRLATLSHPGWVGMVGGG